MLDGRAHRRRGCRAVGSGDEVARAQLGVLGRGHERYEIVAAVDLRQAGDRADLGPDQRSGRGQVAAKQEPGAARRELDTSRPASQVDFAVEALTGRFNRRSLGLRHLPLEARAQVVDRRRVGRPRRPGPPELERRRKQRVKILACRVVNENLMFGYVVGEVAAGETRELLSRAPAQCRRSEGGRRLLRANRCDFPGDFIDDIQ